MIANASELWTTATSQLTGKVGAQMFDLWIAPIRCASIEGDRIRLRAPNQYVRLWFEQNYLPHILDLLRGEDRRDFEVEFEIEAEATRAATPAPIPIEAAAPATPAVSTTPAAAPGEPPHSSLSPKFTFDTFVCGPSNQLAHAAARAISGPNPPRYNPLFICGGAGLGKTHLLHAVGHAILGHRPDARILYLSGERFMNEFIHSLRTDKMREFRRRYREDCDVLLMDDIQFIANKDSTQEEFFHTFNALHEQHKQIVLSADRKPVEIPDIAERLRTRFSMGLTADIEPPELEVRIAILREKARVEGIPLSEEVCLYIAEAFKANVRELEGALIRLAAYASFTAQDISLDFAKQTLAGVARPQSHMSVDHVLKTVANYYQIKVADLKSERRTKAISHPRAVAMFLARKHTGESYPDLGRSFGNKHHTTVLSAFEKIAERLKSDVALKSELSAIENLLSR